MTELERMKEKVKQAHMASGRLDAYSKLAGRIGLRPRMRAAEVVEIIMELAQEEMGRRGTVTPEIDVTGHAIDRASIHLHQYWRRTMRDGEGIHAWLIRMATDSRKIGEGVREGVYVHVGVKFVFEEQGCWPVLKTVMPYRPR